MPSVTLHNGDCLEYMRTMAAGSVDLTVTSPPYDNLRTYGKDFDAAKFDWRSIIAELYRVTKTGGVVVWVVADATIKGSETGTSFRQALWAMECGFNLHDTMIWDKPSISVPTTDRYYASFEYMFVFAKGKPKSINFLCDRTNKSYGEIRKKEKKISADKRQVKNGVTRVIKKYGRRFNVWRISSSESNLTHHPAIFPEALARDHILSWSNVGDTVFDPMMGSGTTGKMAKLNGRNFIGCELDAGYFDIAQRRIAEAQAQPTLFEAAD